MRRSIRPGQVVCLVCGKPHKMLKRHLVVQHGLAPGEYRDRFEGMLHYPMDGAATLCGSLIPSLRNALPSTLVACVRPPLSTRPRLAGDAVAVASAPIRLARYDFGRAALRQTAGIAAMVLMFCREGAGGQVGRHILAERTPGATA
jgi:hypothetical protein